MDNMLSSALLRTLRSARLVKPYRSSSGSLLLLEYVGTGPSTGDAIGREAVAASP